MRTDNSAANHSTSIGLNVFQRIAIQDPSAARDCVDAYGNFIWASARKFTASTGEAETAAMEIFQDIWQHSRHADKFSSARIYLIALIARRLLIRSLRVGSSNLKSMTDIADTDEQGM